MQQESDQVKGSTGLFVGRGNARVQSHPPICWWSSLTQLGLKTEEHEAVITCPPACHGKVWVHWCQREKELPLGVLVTVSLGWKSFNLSKACNKPWPWRKPQKKPLLDVIHTQNSLKLFSLWAFRQWLLYVLCDFDSSSNLSSDLLSFPLIDSSQTIPSLSDTSSSIQTTSPSTSFHICPFISFVLWFPCSIWLSCSLSHWTWRLPWRSSTYVPGHLCWLWACSSRHTGGTLSAMREIDETLEHERNSWACSTG